MEGWISVNTSPQALGSTFPVSHLCKAVWALAWPARPVPGLCGALRASLSRSSCLGIPGCRIDFTAKTWVSSQRNSDTSGWKCLACAPECGASMTGYSGHHATPALPADDGLGRTGCLTPGVSPLFAKLFFPGLFMELIYPQFTQTQWALVTRYLLLIRHVGNWSKICDIQATI